MKKLRILLAGVAAVALLALVMGGVTRTSRAAAISFDLNALVTDRGQQIVSLTLHTAGYRIDPGSLDAGTFRVHVRSTVPYASLDASTVSGFDRDRTVVGASLGADGRIVISLLSGADIGEAYTFACADSIGRTVMLDLRYTITQREPVRADGRGLRFAGFTQGPVVDPEVDAFGTGESGSGLKYRLFAPANAAAQQRRPLIVWLHGGGEGGWAEAQNNDLPLIANRGALGFVTSTAQQIFRGAYVVAPQATDYWMNDKAMNYTPRLKELIDEVVAQNHIDATRIYVTGASNGGYETLALASAYPRYFAAAVPVCPGVRRYLSDDQLAAIRTTPTWIVQSRDDDVLPFVDNGRYAFEHIGNALMTAYDRVVWDGRPFAGHSSWVYVSHNDPTNSSGEHLYQWMADQHR